MRIPFRLRRPKHIATYGLLWAPYIAIYQLVNRFPYFEPTTLSLTAFDRYVPFLPELLPLYVSYIPLYWWTTARAEDDETLTRFFCAAHFQLILCATIWVIFPVTMPRELFYTSQSYNWADTFWRWFDAPNNCLPSLHAANGLLFIHFNWNRRWRWSTTLVSASIIASTVLVKQHYIVDVAAGTVVYVATAVLLRRTQPRIVTNEPTAISDRYDAIPPKARVS